jgi:hypothetical protein
MAIFPLIIGIVNSHKRKETTMRTNKSSQINFKGQQFFIGVDVHKKRWTVTLRHNGLRLKTFSMDPSPETLKHHLEHNYPGGIYHVAYEVGFTGFWIFRSFQKLGISDLYRRQSFRYPYCPQREGQEGRSR